MKKNKKRHAKKSSFRRKRARTRTSSSVSSEATCCTVLSSNKQHGSMVSSVSTPSSSRSSSIKKNATRSDFLSPLESRSEEKLNSIAFYIDNREEMVRHMFASLHRKELYELLPKILKKLKVPELRCLCVKELNEMSKKNICAILKGKDFAENSEPEEEKNESLVINTSIKTPKTEIAVADSTTEMTAPNLSSIFHTVDTNDDCNSITNPPQFHSAAVENISSTKMRQESETVVHSDFSEEHRISLLSNRHTDMFANKHTLCPNGQITAIITTENDDELEDGEVVSDEEKSSNSGQDIKLNKDRNCSQNLTIHKDLFAVSAQDNSSPSSISKNSEYSESSIDITNKVREERRLHMLELELRARAIEALIKRSDNKP
ncbi:unnamed protein product [Cercopithifilaria johnstoni]|uniref:Caspase activity and apoptosis inhibitor 1 n=1 Tax=Cercopithifilaria johnstoni TaxID=2874296 RepID=A0A8J2PQ51_9BILA|nr:unnamed protein product [Cercopithifilaria johnstoni]